MIMKEDTSLAPSYTMQQAEPEAVDLIEKVKALLPKDGSSSFDREQLLLASQKLSISLETPGETVQRLAYLVSLRIYGPLKALKLTHGAADDNSSLSDR